MSQRIASQHADVIVIGGGAAGVMAALAAARRGAATVLVERGPAIGGELISGLPILGAANSLGEWLIGRPARDLLDRCDALGGYVGRPWDGRTMHGACVDPEVMKIVLVQALAEAGVRMLLNAVADDVVVAADGTIEGVVVLTKGGPRLLSGSIVVDASGDADVIERAGGRTQKGGDAGELQPVSLVFRMGMVDFDALLDFIRDNPQEFTLAENPIIEQTPAECAQQIHDTGIPFAVLQAEDEGTIMRRAIDAGEMFPTVGMYIWTTSVARREVGLNATRLAGVDATDATAISDALVTLTEQVRTAVGFLTRSVPGFANASLSAIAPKIGVRETRRVVGDEMLSAEDAMEARKSDRGVAKGGHHVDVHGSGTYQKRVHLAGGGSYDIPWGALIPAGTTNVLVAGRCLSSARGANGSARVMGTCMAMGQAAGTGAAMTVDAGTRRVRDVDVAELRRELIADGAVIEGTA
jgi:ribulose 1,5-bisphosphate synthetase/thiazole synthase